MSSPWCTYWVQLQPDWEVLSPAGAASELVGEVGSLGAVCTAAPWTCLKKELAFQKVHVQ